MRPAVWFGADVLLHRREGAAFRERLRGRRVALVAHPASVDARLRPVWELIDALPDVRLTALLSPQHGFAGEKQDNMVESADAVHPTLRVPILSLYGETRRLREEWMDLFDVLLFDLQDVGVRVYTFMWTMALAMEACAEAGVRFVVLDRPNPIGGLRREGPVLRDAYRSFVGLHPVPLRHGLTCGEMARWLNEERGIGCDLTVIPCEGWQRDMSWGDTGLPWVMPSPNLPTPDSCVVYPGMVLVEGTNMSEGRGTTRPFELFGAPWLDPVALVARLGRARVPGVAFRPCHFEPTFQKHAGALCGGAQLHVTEPDAIEPVRTAIEILAGARALAPHDFAWLDPPYEYEEILAPIDILWGGPGLREGVDAGATSDEILEGADAELEAFSASVERYLLY